MNENITSSEITNTEIRRNIPHLWDKPNHDTEFLISNEALLCDVAERLNEFGYLVCIDFDDCSLVGTITWNDLFGTLRSGVDLRSISAGDVANKKCFKATTENIDEVLQAFRKYRFIPVVDSNGIFKYILTNNANWLSWEYAQNFEIKWQMEFYKRIESSDVSFHDFRNIYIDDIETYRMVQSKTSGSIVLEIGAGPVCGFIQSITDASKRIIIEPLSKEYERLRESYRINVPGANDIQYYDIGADRHIPELVNQVDLVICHNALDHTPEWPFVLGNIAAYTKTDGILYLFTDIDHNRVEPKGHYNITYNPEKLCQFISNIGFSIIYKSYWTRTTGKNCISIVAQKKTI